MEHSSLVEVVRSILISDVETEEEKINMAIILIRNHDMEAPFREVLTGAIESGRTLGYNAGKDEAKETEREAAHNRVIAHLYDPFMVLKDPPKNPDHAFISTKVECDDVALIMAVQADRRKMAKYAANDTNR